MRTNAATSNHSIRRQAPDRAVFRPTRASPRRRSPPD